MTNTIKRSVCLTGPFLRNLDFDQNKGGKDVFELRKSIRQKKKQDLYRVLRYSTIEGIRDYKERAHILKGKSLSQAIFVINRGTNNRASMPKLEKSEIEVRWAPNNNSSNNTSEQ